MESEDSGATSIKQTNIISKKTPVIPLKLNHSRFLICHSNS
jgi:hypothetical protein